MIVSGSVAIAVIISILLGVVLPLSAHPPAIHKQPFGKTADGQAADLYILTNSKGMEVAITNYGATVVTLKVPDRNGKIGDVVLGFDTAGEYESGKSFFGGTIGRYGNRIANGQFTLDGKTYTLPKNDGNNTLHGGILGFNKRFWTAKEVSSKKELGLEFSYLSKDGEEGFPGNLKVKVVFRVPNDKNELRIDYSAETDKETVVNLTNHSYFNLAGEGTGDILSHDLTLYASKFTPVDATLIPNGELRAVKGTPFDFTQSFPIGGRINDANEQIKFGKGYDHNWVLDEAGHASALRLAATVAEPKSGRVLEVMTTEPGIQFYSGNFLDGTVHGKGQKAYQYRSGFCLETQHFPDSPNHANFPSTTLQPGKKYETTTIFRFSAK
jgi:aldose 1-epimerase